MSWALAENIDIMGDAAEADPVPQDVDAADKLADSQPEPMEQLEPPEPGAGYTDKAEGKAGESAADNSNKISTNALPTRSYLEATVVPVLLQGMAQMVKMQPRPENPIEFLAAYLIKNNPQGASGNPLAVLNPAADGVLDTAAASTGGGAQ